MFVPVRTEELDYCWWRAPGTVLMA